MLEVRDPADVRCVVGEVPSMTATQVAAAYARARAGFETWRRNGVLDRATVLARCADLIRARVGDGARTVVRENGKTLAVVLAQALTSKPLSRVAEIAVNLPTPASRRPR
jgi:acyl-CoA reductase-like NAD-dependent aldehyde dehydrogenase